MLLAVDFDEDFIDAEGIAVAAVLPLQSVDINRSELDAPETDSFSADRDPTLRQQIFDIAMTEIESVVEPDSIADDIWRESMSLVGIHLPILPKVTT